MSVVEEEMETQGLENAGPDSSSTALNDMVDVPEGDAKPTPTAYEALLNIAHDPETTAKPTLQASPLAPRRRRGAFGSTITRFIERATTSPNGTLNNINNNSEMDDLLQAVPIADAEESLWNTSAAVASDDEDVFSMDDHDKEKIASTRDTLPLLKDMVPAAVTVQNATVDDTLCTVSKQDGHKSVNKVSHVDEISKDDAASDASDKKSFIDDNKNNSQARSFPQRLPVDLTNKENEEGDSSSTEKVITEPPSLTEEHAPDSLNEFNHDHTTNKQPDEDDVLASTDALFAQVTDKTVVTVKDFMQSLTAEYNCKLDVSLKAAVRQRLVELMIDATASPQGDEENVGSDIGDSEESEADVDEDDDYSSDCDAKKPKAPKKKTFKRTANGSSQKERNLRPKKASKTKLALRVHAEQRRKRRVEELRVRNEELMVHQSVKDQERAEQIAAKFDTNTDNLRLERLEKRLDLLQKLDSKRLACVQLSTDDAAKTIVKEEPMTNINEVLAEKSKGCRNGLLQGELSSEEELADRDTDSSDDDMELEIEGGRSLRVDTSVKPKETKSGQSLCFDPKPRDAMSLLNLADSAKLKPSKTSTGPHVMPSPGRGLNARAALRQQLKQKQRTMGNQWLARELGYKTETDHLQECLLEEKSKREKILKEEQDRLQTNERALLRERMLNAEERLEQDDDMEDPDDEDYKEGVDESDEDDEEMAMAKAIEIERSERNNEEPAADENTAFSSSCPGAPCEDHCVTQASLLASHADSSTECVDEIVADIDKAKNEHDDLVKTSSNEHSFIGALALNEKEKASSEHGDNGGSASVQEFIDAPAFDDNEENEFETQAPLPTDISGVPGSEKGSSTAKSSQDEAVLAEGVTDRVEKSLTTDESTEVTNDAEVVGEEKEKEDGNSVDDKQPKRKGPRNSAWKAMLQRDAEMAKKKKRSSLVEEEADEEEEEEVAGLEDFGFVVKKKKIDDDEDPDLADFDEDDLTHVVDDVSDDEGDEEAGERARKDMEAKEEKERHKEMLRRMRDGYDGRRGGIAGGGAGARGVHRFDQLVAADNRKDAKRLGLLNDDELDSDNEEEGKNVEDDHADEDEDEAVLLDKMLKDRFLHRSSVEEENFSDDDAEADAEADEETGIATKDDEEEKEQERLAKRFAKRARMQRLIEAHGHEEEFSQSKLIDEDTTLKLELQQMKVGSGRFPLFCSC